MKDMLNTNAAIAKIAEKHSKKIKKRVLPENRLYYPTKIEVYTTDGERDTNLVVSKQTGITTILSDGSVIFNILPKLGRGSACKLSYAIPNKFSGEEELIAHLTNFGILVPKPQVEVRGTYVRWDRIKYFIIVESYDVKLKHRERGTLKSAGFRPITLLTTPR